MSIYAAEPKLRSRGARMPDATYEGWGPEARRAAVSITFDNLGEAAELELGIWPDDKPVGKHPSATRVVPRVLNLLREYRVRATFFVEGWNMEIYPDLLRSIIDAGHDLSYHGWRHENWGKLTQGEETALLDKGIELANELGMNLRGFRPPGGALTPSSLQLLAERGFAFCSPGGKAVTLSSGVVILPFEWKAIDAYYYFDQLAQLRESYGDPAHTLGPRRFERAITERLSALVESRQYLALIFHPFLEDDDDRFDTMHRIIDRVVRDESIWCAPCSEVAEWVMGEKGRFEGDPVLDDATWR